MTFWQIKETLTPCGEADFRTNGVPYAAVLTPEEWQKNRDRFEMGIDVEPDLNGIDGTQAAVNYDSLTGAFSLPDRENISGPDHRFAFALDEKGVVFIDAGTTAQDLILRATAGKKWREPGLERFLYDLLEEVIRGDLPLLERCEKELDRLEDAVGKDAEKADVRRLNEIRGDLLDLRIHYEQLLDLGQELEENENGFFRPDLLRYFHLFNARVSRLHASASSLRDSAAQIRDLYQAQLDLRQNRIMTVLTVVTSIFMPLTLITGWYGMNFKYMPELNQPWAYPAVIGVTLAVAAGCLIYFKKKRWL